MDNAEALERLISPPRFSTYVAACDGDRSRAVELYHWTGQVGGAFLVDYRHLEITLRNTLDTTLQVYVEGTVNWPAGTPWFDDERWVRHHWWDSRAEEILKTAKRQAGRGKLKPTQGAIVAELSFAFWRYMISSRYAQSFWTPVLDSTFVGIPGTTADDRRAHLEEHLIPLLKLRNRIAHHEPIFRPFVRAGKGGHRRRVTIEQHHVLLIDVLRWIDRDFADWALANSAVPQLLHQGAASPLVY